MNEESWKPINIWKKAKTEISDMGRIRDAETKEILTQNLHGHGYLMAGGKGVHNLVAAAFIGERPYKHHTHHKDGNKENNNVNNLEYVPYYKHMGDHRTNERHNDYTITTVRIPNDLWRELRHLQADGWMKSLQQVVIDALEIFVKNTKLSMEDRAREKAFGKKKNL